MKICYSVIAINELKNQLICRYGFKSLTDCRLFKSGMNDIYKVKADNSVYYLRISFAGVHSLADYQEEADIMIALGKKGISTAVPMPCVDKSLIWEVDAPEGRRYAVLFTEAISNPSGNNVQKNFNLGQAVAKIHEISDHCDFKVSRSPIDFDYLIQKPLKLLQPYLEEQNSEEYNFICGAMEKLQSLITERLPLEKPFYGFCHGDIHTANVFFQGDNPTFIDFDTMGYGWRSHDISVYILNMESFVNPKFRESEEYKAFIEGYNSVRILTQNEIECINAFAAIRNIWVLGINIELLELKVGSIFIDQTVKSLTGVFRKWYEKVFS